MTRKNPRRADLTLFLSTSGHSGVDRLANLMIRQCAEQGLQIDLVKIKKHGPYVDFEHPNYRCITLETSHTLTALPGLTRYLRQSQPRFMLSDKDSVNRIAILARALSKSKVVHSVRSGTIISEKLKSRSWLDTLIHRFSIGRLYQYAHAVIVPSNFAADDMAAVSGLPRDRISVVPSPIVSEVTLEQAQLPVDHPYFAGSDPVLISVGELSERKDQATLIRAFAALLKLRPAKLLLLGRGKKQEEYERLIIELGIAEHVDLLGFIKNPYPYIKQSNLLVHTARFEGFGMVLVEALYLGTDVVAADCPGGPAQILQNGGLGGLFEVGNHEQLVGAIQYALDHPRDKALIKDQMQPYTVEQSIRSYLKVIGLSEQS